MSMTMTGGLFWGQWHQAQTTEVVEDHAVVGWAHE
jgi:hypothetical protein